MSTTAEKLQKIIDIKNDLKEKINAKGGSITDTTPFAEYPTIADELMGSSGGEGEVRSLKFLLDTIKHMNTFFNDTSITCEDLSKIFQEDDTENVLSWYRTFSNNAVIETIPKFNTKNATRMAEMFNADTKLKILPSMETGKVYDFSYMLNDCVSLETVSGINMKSAGSVGSMFSRCKKLAHLTLYNIKCTLQIGSGTSWGHLLTLDSLLNTIKELIDTGSSKTLTMGSANLNKLANVYVKLTGEPEEDETLPKLPFAVCESTDEGAMLITDYVTLKNWVLA